jgi:DNA invertase Pin-like site-specific DNA recombinase
MMHRKFKKFSHYPLSQHHLDMKANTSQKIQQVVEQLKLENALPNGVAARANAITLHGKISRTTLYRDYNKPLWYPQYEGQSIKTDTTCLSIKT